MMVIRLDVGHYVFTIVYTTRINYVLVNYIAIALKPVWHQSAIRLVIVDWIHGDMWQWKFNQNIIIFIH